jgi:hypothetical protein
MKNLSSVDSAPPPHLHMVCFVQQGILKILPHSLFPILTKVLFICQQYYLSIKSIKFYPKVLT